MSAIGIKRRIEEGDDRLSRVQNANERPEIASPAASRTHTVPFVGGPSLSAAIVCEMHAHTTRAVRAASEK
jgi:hypothetical protein